MKALIPAAGLGTRFLPATKAQPKEMLLVVDKPAIQYVAKTIIGSSAATNLSLFIELIDNSGRNLLFFIGINAALDKNYTL